MQIPYQNPSNNFLNTLKTNPLETFQVIEKIGEGAYSTIYKALNKITDKLVAIKVFPLQLDFPYEEELQFLMNIDHPFIDKIYDAYVEDDQLWLISDYYQLGSIFDIMKITGEPLSEPEISCVCYSILYALDYIHTLNQVHRSIKTSNILVNSLGQIKLSDFGKVQIQQQVTDFLGNMLWGNPDTINDKELDYSADIWALGICVIEMAEGNPLNNSRQLISSKSSHSMAHSSNPIDYSENFNDFVNQCMQVDSTKRPRASKLFEHPFISKYKGEIALIRRKFYQEKTAKIGEYKKGLILQARNQMNHIQKAQQENPWGEENVPDESDMPNNTVEEIAHRLNNNDTIDYTLESDNYLTFIEKPSFNLTEGPSHIEMTNRSPIYMNNCAKTREPLSNIQSLQLDDSYEQSFDITPRIEQPSINLQSSRLDSPDKKRDLRIPPLRIAPTTMYSGKMPTIESQYSSENTYKKSKTNKDELSKSIMSTQNLMTKQRLGKSKMYKATNESNFVVKHRISATTMKTDMDYSVDTDTTIVPISLNRQKLEAFGEKDGGVNTTRQMIEGLENITSNIPRMSCSKEFTASTAADSKAGSSYFKSIFHTPNPSECPKSLILKVVKENLECENGLYTMESPSKGERSEDNHHRKVNIEGEKLRLEAQMKKELEEVRRKYNHMFKGLEKVSLEYKK